MRLAGLLLRLAGALLRLVGPPPPPLLRAAVWFLRLLYFSAPHCCR